MDDIIWFPCYLQPASLLDFGQWEVRPGLRAGLISDNEKALLDSVSLGLPVKENFKPNFLVQIDKELFENALIERLRQQGHDIDQWIKQLPPELQDDLFWPPDDLFRWVVVSISLCQTLNPIFTPAMRYHFRRGEKDNELIATGAGVTGAGYDRSIFTSVSHHNGKASQLNSSILDKIATSIELYYQPIFKRHDPVSIALNCFWAFLFSRFADQAYMSLVIILEALLSTGTGGIVEQISQRAAILIGQSPENRQQIQKEIKKLYKLRSQITHGDLRLKKGPITWNSTFIAATNTTVAIPSLTDLARYSVSVLRNVIENPEIMSAMDKPRRQRKKSLDEFFAKHLADPKLNASRWGMLTAWFSGHCHR